MQIIQPRSSYLICILILLLCSACSQQRDPGVAEFVPNTQFEKSGAAFAESDMQYCTQLTEEYIKAQDELHGLDLNRNQGSDEPRASADLAKVRAVSGQTIRDEILALLHELDQMGVSNPSYNWLLEHCLERRGYEVVIKHGEQVEDRL